MNLSSSDNLAPAACRRTNKSAENPANVIIRPANVYKRVAPLTSMFCSALFKLLFFRGATSFLRQRLKKQSTNWMHVTANSNFCPRDFSSDVKRAGSFGKMISQPHRACGHISCVGMPAYLERASPRCASAVTPHLTGSVPATFPNHDSGLGECQIANARIQAVHSWKRAKDCSQPLAGFILATLRRIARGPCTRHTRPASWGRLVQSASRAADAPPQRESSPGQDQPPRHRPCSRRRAQEAAS